MVCRVCFSQQILPRVAVQVYPVFDLQKRAWGFMLPSSTTFIRHCRLRVQGWQLFHWCRLRLCLQRGMSNALYTLKVGFNSSVLSIALSASLLRRTYRDSEFCGRALLLVSLRCVSQLLCAPGITALRHGVAANETLTIMPHMKGGFRSCFLNASLTIRSGIA